MKRLLFATLLAVTATFAARAEVSVTIGQPGFYGHIDIGGYPQPQLIFPQPIIITPVPTYHAPVYLRVPPGHAKDWGKHCHHYNACNEPVYFVRDDWYEREYVPRYQERYGSHPRDNHRDNDRHDYGHRDNDHRRHEKHRRYKAGRHGSKHNGHGRRQKHGSHGNYGSHGRGKH